VGGCGCMDVLVSMYVCSSCKMADSNKCEISHSFMERDSSICVP